MAGETDLAAMLSGMSPRLLAGDFVFCSLPGASYGDYQLLQPIASFAEPEGLTLVLSQAAADLQGLAYESVFRCITLMVHSSLDAVGLTAAVSTQLAANSISANMIAGYYHDHLFVASADADKAVQLLNALSASSDQVADH